MESSAGNGGAGRAPRRFDVCNGDADGLCAVVQWRLADPAPATLVTGLKRDIALLARVPAQAGDEVLVCDLSMDRNRDALVRLLDRGVRVRYFDHHAPGRIPEHPALEAHIEPASAVCTSVLVDRYLQGRFRAWAVVGAFGDNLPELAGRLAATIGLPEDATRRLRVLGEAINYNAYGADESDVHIAPARLFERLARFADPIRFLERDPIGDEIAALRRADLERAAREGACSEGDGWAVHRLPDAPWSRRVLGSFANALALAQPGRAHAVARPAADGSREVSVRAPLRSPGGAHEFARRFGGAGRARAAGIEGLPAARFDEFVRAFAAMRWAEATTAGDRHAAGATRSGAQRASSRAAR